MAITWQAYEFEQQGRHPHWFKALWIFAAALIAVAVIIKSYLLGVFILLAAGLMHIFALKEPHLFTFALDSTSLQIDHKVYALKDFESFWIFEKENGPMLSLKPKSKKFLSHLHIFLNDAEPDEIKKLLAEAVEEQEHEESLIDILAQKLGF